MAWTVNNLVHGKGLTPLMWLYPPHTSFALGFSMEKEVEGKTVGRTASLPAAVPAVRKVMVTPVWALLGNIPEPSEASSSGPATHPVCRGTVIRFTPTLV